MSTMFCLICTWILSSFSFGQVDSTSNRSFSIGISAGEFGYDSGIGIEVGSPSFLQNKLLVRARASVAWLEVYKATYDHWITYKTISATLVYNFMVVHTARPYIEAGTTIILPRNSFSDVKEIVGITGAAGVELYVAKKPEYNMCYYLSGGVNYCNAYAEKLDNKPRYGSGFVFSNGFRFYF